MSEYNKNTKQKMDLILQPFNGDSVGDYLKRIFNNEFGEFKRFYAAVAFVKSSGLQHIVKSIEDFGLRGGEITIVIGIDHHGTSIEALEMLLRVQSDRIKVFINHVEENFTTFHPKVYLFEREQLAIAILGSNNLTEGGLYTNDEASIGIHLDLFKSDDNRILKELKDGFELWSKEETGNAKLLTTELLQQLIERKYIFPELVLKRANDALEETLDIKAEELQLPLTLNNPQLEKLFGKSFLTRNAPRRPRILSEKPESGIPSDKSLDPFETENIGFVMTLQRTDVGSGQTTPGTSPRSPEIFIPLVARDARPEFWGWQELFKEDPKTRNKMDRLDVKVSLGTSIISVNMMTWPLKSDFRIRSAALRRAGNIGDILRIEKAKSPAFDYYVIIIPPGTNEYEQYLKICTNNVRNSNKKWGYYTFNQSFEIQ